ncbi:hypothetical protein V6N11_013755 [Hibiscus sabdariffa]|uniref:Protein kinase domain-containing protein n=1 Tax=Hibiscus sabdariffa TaxID=183260 RepID=A0ABR2PCV4_9ROSI
MEIKGTLLNIAPESVNENMHDSAVDIWALRCSIVEMFTKKPSWNFKPGTNRVPLLIKIENFKPGTNLVPLLIKIGVIDELPRIPQELSEKGKYFLGKCFVKDPKRRWIDEILLDHPFMAGDDETVSLNQCEEEEVSTFQRCSFEEFSFSLIFSFEFPERVSTKSTNSSQSSSTPSFFRLRCP